MKKHTFRIGFAAILLTGIGAADATGQTVSKTVKPGKGLFEIVYSEKGKAVYVAGIGSRGENNARIFKLDPKTLEVKDSIDVSEAPAFGLGLNDKTQTLYTSNTRSNSVHAIDLKTGKIIATIKNDNERSHTREIVADESTNTIYVSDVGAGVWVIDGKTNTFQRMIDNAGESVTGLALDEKSKKLYIIDMKANSVVTYDLAKNEVVNTFPTGGEGAINIARDAKTKRLFVANQGSGELTVLNEATGELLKTIPTGKGALGVNFNPAKNLVYVANRQAGTLTVVNAATYEIVADLQTGTHPNTVAVTKDGTAYVSNKAKAGARPRQGETPQPQPEDPTGDVVALVTIP